MNKEMEMAIANFKKAARNAGLYDEAAPVILEKGKTLLIKTSRAKAGRAMVNGR